MTTNEIESKEKIVVKHPYFQTFIALLVLTVIEVAIGYLPSSSLVTMVLLIFALAKVGLVVAIFMHVKYEKNPALIIFGVFIGIMLIMFGYNLLLSFSLKDFSHLYLSLFTFSMLAFILSYTGVASQYIWPELVWWNNKSIPQCLRS